MSINYEQDWPAYLLLAAVFWFFIYVVIKGRSGKKGDK